MKHDVLTEAAIRRAKNAVQYEQAQQRAKQEWEARERLDLQRRGERIKMEREIIHEAQQTLKGINDAIMAHFSIK
ncbi:MAG: DNA-binding protein [Prevotella sp.]